MGIVGTGINFYDFWQQLQPVADPPGRKGSRLIYRTMPDESGNYTELY
jgi:hypothetical protein